MTRSVICAALSALVVINLAIIEAAPQFGGGSFSQANAQSGAFGGQQRYPGQYPPHLQRPAYGGGPGFGARGPGIGGGRGLGANRNSGVSISIAKSVSIGGGGGGGSSQAQASSGARGK